MPEVEVEIEGRKINGGSQIVLNLKSLIVVIGLLISLSGTIFGVVTNKLSKLSTEINVLEETVEGYSSTVNSVQSQNTIILLHYGIDIEVEAEEAAASRRNDRPTSLGNN